MFESLFDRVIDKLFEVSANKPIISLWPIDYGLILPYSVSL